MNKLKVIDIILIILTTLYVTTKLVAIYIFDNGHIIILLFTYT